jgi:hypothetical protein
MDFLDILAKNRVQQENIMLEGCNILNMLYSVIDKMHCIKIAFTSDNTWGWLA